MTGHSLRYLIIENFIPPEEKNKIMNRLYFDGEEDQWKFQPLVPTGGYVPGPDPRSAPALPTRGHKASACRSGVSLGLGGGGQQGPWGACRCQWLEVLSKPSPTRKGHPALAVDELCPSLSGCSFVDNFVL